MVTASGPRYVDLVVLVRLVPPRPCQVVLDVRCHLRITSVIWLLWPDADSAAVILRIPTACGPSILVFEWAICRAESRFRGFLEDGFLLELQPDRGTMKFRI